MSKSYISHHGIKGQKWGVQNGPPYPIEKTLNKQYDEKTVLKRMSSKNKKEVTLEQASRTKFQRFTAKHFNKLLREQMNTKIFDIKVDDKVVGDLQLYQIDDETVNGVWLGIDENERGKGYASASLKAAIDFAKERGYKKFTLEVPGNSPDARHIYEREGFKALYEVTSKEDDYAWGGLTAMELNLK